MDTNAFDFWEGFQGDMTLKNVIHHYHQINSDNHTLSKEYVAENILPQVIGKNFEKRKLLELFEMELNNTDPMPSVQKESKKFHEHMSIFDMDKLDGYSFQYFIKEILESNDFTDVEVIGKSGDQGGDLLAMKDDVKLVIQAKKYSVDRKVTNSAVQEVLGAIAYYNANKGVVITNSIFTPSAKELAKINNIELWDRKKLTEFIVNHNSKKDTVAS